MALATRCPHCDTIFRVAQDQLKLRAGLVRCGSCKQIFNGMEHLLLPGQSIVPTPAVVTAPATQPAAATSITIDVPAAETVSISPALPDVVENNAEPYSPVVEEITAEEEQTVMESVAEAATAQTLPAQVAPPVSSAPSIASDLEEQKADTPVDFFDLDEFLKPASASAPPSPPSEISNTSADIAANRLETTPSLATTQIDAEIEEEPEDSPISRPLAEVSFAETAYIEEHLSHAEPIENISTARTLGDMRTRTGRLHSPIIEETPISVEEADEPEEPAFVRQARRKQRNARINRLIMGVGSVFLLIGLVGQGGYIFRDQIAARFPQAKPVLLSMCSVLRCDINLPAQIDAVSIESTELQTLTTRKNTLVLTALLHNHSTVAQAWPHVELTLNDANEKPVARRIFLPREYLAMPQEVMKGFTPNSERLLNVYFELSQLKASGYKVGVFYP
jgi:predicted Zn finger-like uncharacterized protein